MWLNSGEGNGVSLVGRTSQSIARIARNDRKVLALQAHRAVATPMGDRPHMQTGR